MRACLYSFMYPSPLLAFILVCALVYMPNQIIRLPGRQAPYGATHMDWISASSWLREGGKASEGVAFNRSATEA